MSCLCISLCRGIQIFGKIQVFTVALKIKEHTSMSYVCILCSLF